MNNTTKNTKQNSLWVNMLPCILFFYTINLFFMYIFFYEGRELIDARWGIPGMAMIGFYFMGIIFSVASLLLIILGAISLYDKITYSKYKAIQKTGIYEFISAATYTEELRNIVYKQQNNIKDVIKIIENLDNETFRDVVGVVCNEEIVGIADGPHLTVTVTKPLTLKTFKKLPKKTREYVSVVYAPEE